MHRTALRLAALSLGLTTLAMAGCSNPCTQLRADYEKALESESPFLETVADAPHFGFTVHTDVLNTTLNETLKKPIQDAMELSDTIKVPGGQEISFKTNGSVEDLEIVADSACPSCVRVSGNLAGNLGVKVPVLPIQRVALRGSTSLVAPVKIERSDDGTAGLVLDAREMKRLNKSTLDAEFEQLPPTWAKLLKRPISNALLDAVVARIDTIPIVELKPLDLGIEGLQIVPARVEVDAKRKLIYVGFATNLRGASPTLSSPFAADAKQPLAASVHPDTLTSALKAAVGAGVIPRTYTKAGKASSTGPFHATIGSFSLEDVQDSRANFELAFRLWNLPESGTCYWVDSLATGTFGVDDAQNAAVRVDSLTIDDTSMNDLVFAIATWGKSEFIEESTNVLEHSFADDAITFPGTRAVFAAPSFTSQDGSVVLKTTIQDAESESK